LHLPQRFSWLTGISGDRHAAIAGRQFANLGMTVVYHREMIVIAAALGVLMVHVIPRWSIDLKA
jgi:hypothetical protein